MLIHFQNRSPVRFHAKSIPELVEKMNALQGTDDVQLDAVQDAIARYDGNIARGPKFHNDEQLRRIAHARQYKGDRVRTCKFQPINDPKAMPLILGPIAPCRRFHSARSTSPMMWSTTPASNPSSITSSRPRCRVM
jgi:predicted oxidoreductase